MSRDRVVLVHDRQDAQVEQPFHGALGVAAVSRILEVASRQKYLAGHDPVAVEAVLISVDEHVLADRCSGLLGGEIVGPRVEFQVRHTGRDRAGGDEDHLRATRVRRGQRVDERLDLPDVVTADGR